MPAPVFVPLRNEPRDYAWGMPGGISRAFGLPATSQPEAELWLGAHPASPSRMRGAPWADLAAWERAQDRRLPYLFKVLAAGAPLSLQAHPTTEMAVAGYDDEERRGILRDAPTRNYKDPFAKPELIVAALDGFEALCGFRRVEESIAALERLAALASDATLFAPLFAALRGVDGLRRAVQWLLSGADPRRDALVGAVVDAAAREPDRFALVQKLASAHPGDPGIVVALLMNHVTLMQGECLWLPAGNIHAYLDGLGIELMGPSDNVLRGGLTGKHVDVPELLRVLDFTDGPAPYLAPRRDQPHVSSYRPSSVPSGAGVDFELRLVTGDAVVPVQAPAIGLVLEGTFTLTLGDEEHGMGRGDAVFLSAGDELGIRGRGWLYLASADR